MRLAGIDIETTGVDQAAGDRIIEIAIVVYDSISRTVVDSMLQRIDPQRPISAKAQAVHGIAYDDLAGCPTWEDIAPEVAKILGTADVLVAHNAGFDLPFVAGELYRVGIEIPSALSVCTMEEARWACADGKNPKLRELCFSLGVEYDPAKAHAAIYDVDVTIQCFFKGLDRGFFTLPSTAT